jgi:hypothetical protein
MAVSVHLYLSICAFKFGDLRGSRNDSTSALFNMDRKASRYFLSRSRMAKNSAQTQIPTIDVERRAIRNHVESSHFIKDTYLCTRRQDGKMARNNEGKPHKYPFCGVSRQAAVLLFFNSEILNGKVA